ncbi:MAG TPA: HEAT repeat domain-containing protein [Thermoanaerobaculia bacterium]|nr:HEAT repeat domain-containing protein [Thermoanaerobaculia bacterium]
MKAPGHQNGTAEDVRSAALEQLWKRIEAARATDQERVEAAVLAGKLGDQLSIPRLKRLLDDPYEEVRYFALQSLVFDLKQKDTEVAERCWEMLIADPDIDQLVPHMAASCLGSIYFGQRRKDVFKRMLGLLHDSELSAFVKGGVYTSVHQLAGLPPREWPGLMGPRKVFEESDIDWKKMAELEAIMSE